MSNFGSIFLIKRPTRTGDDKIDGILGHSQWRYVDLTYSFPTSNDVYYATGYNDSGDYKEPKYFAAFSDAQKKAVYFALDKDIGSAASAGFSVEGFTNLNMGLDDTADVTSPEALRFGNTRPPGVPENLSGHTYTNGDKRGDVWIDGDSVRNPEAGSRAWWVSHHEIGHALGLSHSFESVRGFPKVPIEYDSKLLTVMAYYARSESAYVNLKSGGEPQTWMMFDIAALQHLYGANYSVNSGNTTYKWVPWNGNTYVNGDVGIDASANRINATVWDGGGIDTYDLSAYSANLRLDLRPGNGSLFSAQQAAYSSNSSLIPTTPNIYNALLYNGDARSLIENARGGSGNDTIFGNTAKNVLSGNGGNDSLYGDDGDDRLSGGLGNDKLYGGKGNDQLIGDSGDDFLNGDSGNDKLYGGIGNDHLVGDSGNDFLKGNSGNDTLEGGDGIDTIYGNNGNDRLKGDSGNDRLEGGNGNDRLEGGSGNDALHGGFGRDLLYGNADDDRLYGNAGNDKLYGDSGSDRLDGGTGADVLEGGSGRDFMLAGNDSDRDVFVFRSPSESGLASTARDSIYEFDSGEDDIDLSAIDANIRADGNQTFTFSTTGAAANAVWAVDTGADLVVYGDVNGNTTPDFSIRMVGINTLLASDFIL